MFTDISAAYTHKPSFAFGVLDLMTDQLEAEYGRWALWVPVAFGLGIWCYFALLTEPSWYIVSAGCLTGLATITLTNSLAERRFLVGFALSSCIFWVACGFALAKIHIVRLDHPVIAQKTDRLKVKGWITHIHRKTPKQARVMIRVHDIQSYRSEQTPDYVRLRVNAKAGQLTFGSYVILDAILYPLPQPVLPGGFDYGRKLWFEQIGGLGFVLKPPEISKDAPQAPLSIQLQAQINQLRSVIAERIRAVLPGVSGHVAVALITGDRSGLSEETTQALRYSGLAHVLAISGLHMAMIAGALFWAVRLCLASVPAIALRFPIKKIAAVIALVGGGYYLLLSGGAIATQRAFIMIAIMFAAILLDRPALSLRNVAIAALIILFLSPHSLLDVGFQMSFAAVTGLVAYYERASRKRYERLIEGPRPTKAPQISGVFAFLSQVLQYVTGIAITTIVASIAVAPIAIYYFNHYSQFGLIGNLLAMPVVGMIIMPMALLVLLLTPLGFEALPLSIMGWGIDLLLDVAHTVSQWPGAVKYFAQMPSGALACMVLGGLWVVIWQKRWRYWGVIGIALGLALWPLMRFPDILIERDGKTIAVVQEDGRLTALPGRSGTFSLKQWLRIYGDTRPLKDVRNKKAFQCDPQGCLITVKNRVVGYIKHPLALHEDCGKADIIVSRVPHLGQCQSSEIVIDNTDLKRHGAYSLFIEDHGIEVRTVRQSLGNRPWTTAP